jgi:NADH-quinone oxidoreductase subunit N
VNLTLPEFVSRFLDPTAPSALPMSLQLFRPELVLCVTIVALLVMRIFFRPRGTDALIVALGGTAIALYYSIPWKFDPAVIGGAERAEIFSQLLVYDRFTVFFRALLIGFAMLLVILTRLTGIPDAEDSPDFYTMLLGATLGLCIMSSANHLLTVFLGVEMASVPSYAMAGLLKGRRQSSEAALKYAVFGAGAAGVMLYGISLIAGVLGTCHLPTMAERLAEMVASEQIAPPSMVLALGGLMIMVGLAYKLSAVPFHFWAPDVFTGASAEVNAFLSIASKAGAMALLIRVAIGFGYGAVPASATVTPEPATKVSATTETGQQFVNKVETAAQATAATPAPASPVAKVPLSNEQRIKNLAPIRQFIVWVLSVMAMLTATFGNLAAYGQTNIKRMLAYSTIAHAGYMIMAVAAGLALAGVDNEKAQRALAAVPFYLATYLFMNLTAFGAVAYLRNTLRSEEYSAYAGLIRTNPGVTICLSVALVSLIGLPPLAGFIGKLYIFAGLTEAMFSAPGYRGLMISMLVVAGVNTAISLYYYLRVVKIMTIDPLPSDRPQPEFQLLSLRGIYLVAMTVPVVLLGIWFSQLTNLTIQVSRSLLN